MLILTLDGRSLDAGSLQAGTLAELIRSVEQDLGPERVIVAMTLDGRSLDQEREKADAARPLENMQRLDITTQRVIDLARSTLRSMIEFIPRIAAQLADCVEELHGARDAEGYEHLKKAIDGLQLVASAWPPIVRWLSAEGWPVDALAPRTEGFNELLGGIARAQETGDVVLLCDSLEFELGEFLESWQGHAGQLLEQLERND
ncbi:hypothetical protein LLH00_13335 [bacterium]|nr:hypothetical protein [bacterium]